MEERVPSYKEQLFFPYKQALTYRLLKTINDNNFSLWLEDFDRVSEPVYRVLELVVKPIPVNQKVH